MSSSRATRIGDGTTGICDLGEECCPHGRAGVNTEGSNNVFINKKPAHRLNDGGNCNCPHDSSYVSTSASTTVFANGKGITRIGDSTSCIACGCHGSHVVGSPDVFIGG